MSHDLTIWIHRGDFDDIPIHDMHEQIVAFAEPLGLEVVAVELIDAFAESERSKGPFTFYRTYFGMIRDLCKEIARLAPKASFYVQAVGDDLDELYLAAYEEGAETLYKSLEGAFADRV
jgi:hypothetical protein